MTNTAPFKALLLAAAIAATPAVAIAGDDDKARDMISRASAKLELLQDQSIPAGARTHYKLAINKIQTAKAELDDGDEDETMWAAHEADGLTEVISVEIDKAQLEAKCDNGDLW